ncbi:MAG: hypothetical protein AB7U23_14810 [Dehalococcoidia bacterium]
MDALKAGEASIRVRGPRAKLELEPSARLRIDQKHPTIDAGAAIQTMTVGVQCVLDGNDSAAQFLLGAPADGVDQSAIEDAWNDLKARISEDLITLQLRHQYAFRRSVERNGLRGLRWQVQHRLLTTAHEGRVRHPYVSVTLLPYGRLIDNPFPFAMWIGDSRESDSPIFELDADDLDYLIDRLERARAEMAESEPASAPAAAPEPESAHE